MGLGSSFDQIFSKVGHPALQSNFGENVRVYPGDDPDYPIKGAVDLSNGNFDKQLIVEEEKLQCCLVCDYDASTGIVDPRRGWWITLPAEGNAVKYRFSHIENIGGGSVVSVWINERISDMYSNAPT